MNREKQIYFNEKSGLTSYSASRVDKSTFSALLVIIGLTTIKKILECTNIYAQTLHHKISFDKEEIIAFNGILFCRGFICPGALWSKKYGIPFVSVFIKIFTFYEILAF